MSYDNWLTTDPADLNPDNAPPGYFAINIDRPTVDVDEDEDCEEPVEEDDVIIDPADTTDEGSHGLFDHSGGNPVPTVP